MFSGNAKVKPAYTGDSYFEEHYCGISRGTLLVASEDLVNEMSRLYRFTASLKYYNKSIPHLLVEYMLTTPEDSATSFQCDNGRMVKTFIKSVDSSRMRDKNKIYISKDAVKYEKDFLIVIQPANPLFSSSSLEL